MMMSDIGQIEMEEMTVLLQADRCKAFGLFYDKYASVIYGVVVKCLGENEKGNKAFEDIMMSAWDKICNNEAEAERCLTYMLSALRKQVNDAGETSANAEEENIFKLCIVNGYTIEEMANKFNLSVEETRKSLRKLLKHLQIEY